MGRRPPKNLIISPSPLSFNYFRKLNKSILDFLLKFCYNIYVRGKQSSPFSPVPSYTWGAPSAKGWRSFFIYTKIVYSIHARNFNIIFIPYLYIYPTPLYHIIKSRKSQKKFFLKLYTVYKTYPKTYGRAHH